MDVALVTMGIKGCWTCRERKVRCDGQMPTCGNCAKTRRRCQGYGVQLSWPREGDRKRALVLGDDDALRLRKSTKSDTISLPVRARFVNVGSWDMALAAIAELHGVPSPAVYMRSISMATQFPNPTYLPPLVMKKDESQLVHFFTESASLVLGPTDAETLLHFILRIALSNSNAPDTTNPVLQAVFALASLQLNGETSAFRYQRRAVAKISSEETDRLNETALLKNMVAKMLLYHFEVGSRTSSRRDTWVTFFCAVKSIIKTSPAMAKLVRREYSVFLDWIYYHEALAEFSVRHWRIPYEGCGLRPVVWSAIAEEEMGERREQGIGCPTEVMELLVNACRQAIVPPSPELEYTAAEMERAKVLERRVSTAVGDFGPISASSTTTKNRSTMVSDLHRIACLIYVNRAVHKVSEADFRHRRLVREGIMLLGELETCQSAWPLFVIGCEAVDDEQRLGILQVCERSRQDPRRRSSHIESTLGLVQAVWNQRDLDENGQVEFMAIFDSVIGGVKHMPLFA